jgi:hypothetical protein
LAPGSPIGQQQVWVRRPSGAVALGLCTWSTGGSGEKTSGGGGGRAMMAEAGLAKGISGARVLTGEEQDSKGGSGGGLIRFGTGTPLRMMGEGRPGKSIGFNFCSRWILPDIAFEETLKARAIFEILSPAFHAFLRPSISSSVHSTASLLFWEVLSGTTMMSRPAIGKTLRISLLSRQPRFGIDIA